MDVILGTISLHDDLTVERPRGMRTSDARKAAAERQLCKCPKDAEPRYVRYCCDCGRRVE